MPLSLSSALRDRARELATTLRVHGVNTVEAAYDGYGDEGMFEEIAFYDRAEQSVKMPDAIDKSKEDFFYDLLYEYFAGWKNNDGAFGQLTWNLDQETIHSEHSTRHTFYREGTFTLNESRP